MCAELIAANYTSRHPVLGILTNLVDRFILAYITEVDNSKNRQQNQTETANKRKSRYNVAIFDTQDCLFAGYPSHKRLEFACLIISNWLSKCSFDINFDRNDHVLVQDPYDVEFFDPLFKTCESLRDFFHSSNKDEKDEYFQNFLEQMNAVCESQAEKAMFIRDRFLSEFSCYNLTESPDFKHNSMYA